MLVDCVVLSRRKYQKQCCDACRRVQLEGSYMPPFVAAVARQQYFEEYRAVCNPQFLYDCIKRRELVMLRCNIELAKCGGNLSFFCFVGSLYGFRTRTNRRYSLRSFQFFFNRSSHCERRRLRSQYRARDPISANLSAAAFGPAL